MSVAMTMKSTTAQLRLPSQRGPYYSGKWQKSTGPDVDVTAPGSGASLGKVAGGTATDAWAAIAAAKGALKEWGRVPPLERAKMLRAIADVLRKNGDELAMIDAADCGNPHPERVCDAQAGRAG